jgi:hypothetical protein
MYCPDFAIYGYKTSEKTAAGDGLPPAPKPAKEAANAR